MINSLPKSLIQAVQNVVENQDVLESCVTCGMVNGSCVHTDGTDLWEDAITKEPIPDKDDEKEELSGDSTDVIINPPYKTFISRINNRNV